MRSTAEYRHESLLWGDPSVVSSPVPVAASLLIEDGYLEEAYLEDQTALADDARWARFARRLWVTPQGYLSWWVSRRWVRPRDITKE